MNKKLHYYEIPVTYTCHGYVSQLGENFEEAYDKVSQKIDEDRVLLADVVITSVIDLDVRPIVYVNQA